MALQTSGAISINDIVGEFGGTAPHSLSEYYGVAAGIPSSGAISLSDFYGASAFTPYDLSGLQTYAGNKQLSGGGIAANGIQISHDGLTVSWWYEPSNELFTMQLSTAWDITTGATPVITNIGGNFFHTARWTDNGSKLILQTGSNGLTYTATTPYDPTTITGGYYQQFSLNLTPNIYVAYMMDISNDGRYVLIQDSPYASTFWVGCVYLSSPWDYTTAVGISDIQVVGDSNSQYRGTSMSPDGKYFYACGSYFTTPALQYKMSTPFSPSTATLDYTMPKPSFTSGLYSVAFKTPSGDRSYFLSQSQMTGYQDIIQFVP
jgi:hypothetical protein